MARFEWLIIDFIVLGLAVFELIRTRRGIRRLHEAERARNSEADGDTPARDEHSS